MKIVTPKKDNTVIPLSYAHWGDVIRFTKRLCDYPMDELYIVLQVCGSYANRTEHGCATDKIGVANLSNGKLSFVVPTRAAILMNAEVKNNGPRS